VKKDVNPGVFIAIIAAVVVIAAIVIFAVYRAPASAVAGSTDHDATLSGSAGPKKGTAMSNEMMSGHMKTADQRAQIEEWKRTHPDGFTRH
jgi:Spy/CpxP family protein refolding chaperone